MYLSDLRVYFKVELSLNNPTHMYKVSDLRVYFKVELYSE